MSIHIHKKPLSHTIFRLFLSDIPNCTLLNFFAKIISLVSDLIQQKTNRFFFFKIFLESNIFFMRKIPLTTHESRLSSETFLLDFFYANPKTYFFIKKNDFFMFGFSVKKYKKN